MKKLYKYLLLLPLLFSFTVSVWAFDSSDTFVVKRIEVVGNRGLSTGTVLNYLPISIGEQYNDQKSAEIVEALYKSGFFTNVNVGRQGNTLVISVEERATIASVKVTGNSDIKKDDMKNALTQAGLTTGNIYNRAEVANFKQQIQAQYLAMGYYNARVSINVQNLPRSRVAVTINIQTGKAAKIQSINFIGNQSFSSHTLRSQMFITTPRLWSCITKGDQYSRPKLDASLEAIKSYYMNHGYIHFRVVSTDVALSPDHQHVNITITVSEGAQYRFGGYKFSGNTILTTPELNKLVTFTNGSIFSRQEIISTEKAITLALGDRGYGFANVQPLPTINENDKSVFINFNIMPGNKVYVRRIMFQGDTITADYVLRRSMQQMEGGLLSSRKVEESIRQIKLLGFFSNVTVQTVPVPGTNNQVDLIYNVSETPAGQAMVSLGYGTLGWQVGAGVTQPNFLGTGKTVGVNFTGSAYQKSYTINYYNPYYTLNGIGRGLNLFYTTTSPNRINLSGSYAFNTYGGNVYYNVPISLNNTFTMGYGLSHIQLRTFGCSLQQAQKGRCTPISNEVNDFVNKYGTSFNELTLNSGWQYLGLDRAIFPTEGLTTSISGQVSVPAFKNTLRYYKTGASASYFLPLNHFHTFIINFTGNLAFGNGYDSTYGLPFFLNYYAGGLAQGLVRGFETNTLGPRDSNFEPIGGNYLVNGTINFIFPNFISPDNLRTSLFLDAGNVYQTEENIKPSRNNPGYILSTFPGGPIRESVGLAVQWRSPLGPIDLSLGMPVYKRHHDETEPFQFTMGTSF